MCLALNQISKLSIVLKDIKPANMMIVSPFLPEKDVSKQRLLYPDIIPDDGMPDTLRAVLIDFGFARQFVCSAQVCEFAGTPSTVCICLRFVSCMQY